MVINFSAPMDKESVKITIAPTITNQYVFWQGDEKQGGDLTARISGGWQASTNYVVTVSADSRGRYGDKLGHDVVIKFTTAPLDPNVTLNVPGMMGMYDVNGAQLMYATYVNMDKINYSLSRVDRDDFLKLIGRDSFQVWQNYRPPAANKLRDWTQSVSTSLNAARLVSTTLTTGAPLTAGVYYLEANASANAAGKTWDKHLLVVTGVNLALKRTSSEALVWATDLKTGKPVANLPLTLFGNTSTATASGQTDADGVYRTALNNVRVFDPVFAISEQAGRVVAAVGSDWSNGIAPFDFSLGVADLDKPVLRIVANAGRLDLEVMKFIRLPWAPSPPAHFFPVPVVGHMEAAHANLDHTQLDSRFGKVQCRNGPYQLEQGRTPERVSACCACFHLIRHAPDASERCARSQRRFCGAGSWRAGSSSLSPRSANLAAPFSYLRHARRR